MINSTWEIVGFSDVQRQFQIMMIHGLMIRNQSLTVEKVTTETIFNFINQANIHRLTFGNSLMFMSMMMK